jgi:hypothetical protein
MHVSKLVIDSLECAGIESKIIDICFGPMGKGCPEYVVQHLSTICSTMRGTKKDHCVKPSCELMVERISLCQKICLIMINDREGNRSGILRTLPFSTPTPPYYD